MIHRDFHLERGGLEQHANTTMTNVNKVATAEIVTSTPVKLEIVVDRLAKTRLTDVYASVSYQRTRTAVVWLNLDDDGVGLPTIMFVTFNAPKFHLRFLILKRVETFLCSSFTGVTCCSQFSYILSPLYWCQFSVERFRI